MCVLSVWILFWVGAGLFCFSLSVSILCVWRGVVSRYVFFLYLWIVAFCFAIIYSHMSTTATFHPFSLFPQTLLDQPSRLSLPKMVMVLALGETKRQIEGKPTFPTPEERPRGLCFVLFCPKFIRHRFPFLSLSMLLFLFPRHSLLLTHSHSKSSHNPPPSPATATHSLRAHRKQAWQTRTNQA